MPVRRPRGPSPEEIRRRRIAALGAILVALVAIVIAVVIALPHVESKSTPTTTAVIAAPKPFKIILWRSLVV